MALCLSDYGTHVKCIPLFLLIFVKSFHVSLLAKGNWTAALQFYSEAVEFHPECPPAHFNLGVAYSEKGQFEKVILFLVELVSNICYLIFEALQEYEIALAHKPDYVEALCNVGTATGRLNTSPYHFSGVIYKQQGRLSDAISCYEKAVTLNPMQEFITKNLAIALTDLGTEIKEKGCHRYQ